MVESHKYHGKGQQRHAGSHITADFSADTVFCTATTVLDFEAEKTKNSSLMNVGLGSEDVTLSSSNPEKGGRSWFE